MSTDRRQTMPLHIQLFGRYRDMAASDHVVFDLPHGATVGDLVSHLHDAIRHGLPKRPAVIVNRQQALDSQILEATDEIALIPPVAGG
ncbi:MAG: MoaD/ThiS family protein [Gemmatimonadales bacterium]|nr:MAG: MoaD/ThiS family protein [Gemmatimonadales bacterium]